MTSSAMSSTASGSAMSNMKCRALAMSAPGCPRSAHALRVAALTFLSLMAWTAQATALDETAAEEAALKACEKSVCTMILGKEPKGADLACNVQKTWAKTKLDEGRSKGISWGFGDARCKVDLKLSRADVIGALTKPKHKVFVRPHDVNCVIEREGQLQTVTARLAPKLVFKDGKADKVWINLESIEGPTDVKSTISAAAKLEDSIGVFHKPMIKQINKFIHQQCAKRYGPRSVANKAAPAKPAVKKKTPEASAPDKGAPPAKAAAGETAAKPPIERQKADVTP